MVWFRSTIGAMHGALLICGGSVLSRKKRAWEILAEPGFKASTPDPDLLIIRREEDRKSVGIAQTRAVLQFLWEKPFAKSLKAVLIEQAESLTHDAQGSLLKILEEPPAFALIILLSTAEGALLPTVVSRCRRMSVPIDTGLGSGESYDLGSQSYDALFTLAGELAAKEKNEVIQFLEGLLRFDIYRGETLLVEKLAVAIKRLREANVSVKFALEYIFLLHKKSV